MHERSLVRMLLQQVEQVLAEHGGSGVAEVAVELGPLSGVEPLLVEEAFAQLAPQTAVRGAQLVIHHVPLEAVCRSCAATFVVEAFHFICPHCASRQLEILRGDGFRLWDVTLFQPASEVPQP